MIRVACLALVPGSIHCTWCIRTRLAALVWSSTNLGSLFAVYDRNCPTSSGHRVKSSSTHSMETSTGSACAMPCPDQANATIAIVAHFIEHLHAALMTVSQSCQVHSVSPLGEERTLFWWRPQDWFSIHQRATDATPSAKRAIRRGGIRSRSERRPTRKLSVVSLCVEIAKRVTVGHFDRWAFARFAILAHPPCSKPTPSLALCAWYGHSQSALAPHSL